VNIVVPIDAPELRTLTVQLANVSAHLGDITERLNRMATQEQVDALAAAVTDAVDKITAALAGIRADIDALKQQANVDVAPLEAKVAQAAAAAQALADLDAENPPA